MSNLQLLTMVFISAFIGTFSHVFLDSIMHSDVEPFFPSFLKIICWEFLPLSNYINGACIVVLQVLLCTI